MADAPTLFLIDGSNQMYRAYHAIRGLTGPDGKSTNAVYGFVTMLRKLIADHQPAYIGASFDLAGRTFRSQLAADYKANASAMPGDLAEQIPWVHEACAALGVPVYTAEGFEADDVIGTLAQQGGGAGISASRSSPATRTSSSWSATASASTTRATRALGSTGGVKEKFGVAPAQVIDVLALMGDSIDNVAGVPGIGEKGARDLIAGFGSLDALLARAGEVPQKKYREGLQTHADQARQSRELVRIRTDVDVPFDAEVFRYRGPVRGALLRAVLEARIPHAGHRVRADGLLDCQKDYAAVATPRGARGARADAASRPAASRCASSPTARRVCAPRSIGLVFSMAPRQARYVPLGHEGFAGGASLDRSAALEILRPVLEDPAVGKVGHDLKADAVVLCAARHRPRRPGVRHDAGELPDRRHQIEPGARADRARAARLQGADPGRSLRQGRQGAALRAGAGRRILDFAGERADLALQLAAQLEPMLAEQELETRLPRSRAAARADSGRPRAGRHPRRRRARWPSQAALVERELTERSATIFALAGEEFNINSPKQLAEILFDKLKLPVLKRTGASRAPSTAVEVLEELALGARPAAPDSRVAGAGQAEGHLHRRAAAVDQSGDRTRPHLVQSGGRGNRAGSSSSDPNLQNIPIRTEIGREIRRAFIAEPGHRLISADYSQIELRVLAHLSGDETLIAAFARGEDIHDRTALKVFGENSGLDPHELRRRAKIVNYALLYGKTAFTLAKDIGVTQQAAQEFIDAYFAGFPSVRGFIDQTLDDARAHRRGQDDVRPAPAGAGADEQERPDSRRRRARGGQPADPGHGRRHPQARDDRRARPRSRARSLSARMILTVHDELLFESPADQSAGGRGAGARDACPRAVPLKVPLDVDVGIGENWKEAKS